METIWVHVHLKCKSTEIFEWKAEPGQLKTEWPLPSAMCSCERSFQNQLPRSGFFKVWLEERPHQNNAWCLLKGTLVSPYPVKSESPRQDPEPYPSNKLLRSFLWHCSAWDRDWMSGSQTSLFMELPRPQTNEIQGSGWWVSGTGSL